MFDEEGVKSTSAPANLPVEPVDMLASVEHDERMQTTIPNAVSAGLLKKKEPPPQLAEAVQAASHASSGRKWLKALGVVVFIVVMGGALGAGIWWFMFASKAPVMQPVSETNEVSPPTTPSVNTTDSADPLETTPVSQTVTTTTKVMDADQDGLSDERESQLGTNPNNPDTDDDLLTDGDEVLIWKTNPLIRDTDGDGHGDGVEIKNGYNPAGDGRLFPVAPSTTATTSSSTL